MSKAPRLDILLYCHDGRGIGHASRTVTIGMALRRLYPQLRILFVSGTPFTHELRDGAPLDWLKLPSYETEVVDGKSRGAEGNSKFSDQELGEFRAATIAHYVQLYAPRVILADHSPLGKHKELVPALKSTADKDTQWVLGVRGVVGKVKQVQSTPAADTFRTHFRGLLWYGDSSVLLNENLNQLRRIYGINPVETGYVSRISELQKLKKNTSHTTRTFAGAISIPWLGESSHLPLNALKEVLPRFKTDSGLWNIFLPKGTGEADDYRDIFNSLHNCTARPFGPDYHDILVQSKTALIYGGYNSLTDILFTRTPSLVLQRGMQDDEQQEHLRMLTDRCGGGIISLAEEEATPDVLQTHLATLIQHRDTTGFSRINLSGAEKAAHYLAALIK